jgi:cytidyltransferase-like protein
MHREVDADVGAEVALHDCSFPRQLEARVFINGCWDLMHAGHYNALRQAAKFGSKLVVGIHPNEWIRRIKGGAFILSESEKETMLLGCKYVDEVAHDIPYAEIDLAILHRPDVRCQYVSHGDDPIVLPSGCDMFASAKAADRYREFRRSEGISTTWLINRLLAATRELESDSSSMAGAAPAPMQRFTLTSQRLGYFSNYPERRIDAAKRVVYIDGDWDLFHVCLARAVSGMPCGPVRRMARDAGGASRGSSASIVVGRLPAGWRTCRRGRPRVTLSSLSPPSGSAALLSARSLTYARTYSHVRMHARARTHECKHAGATHMQSCSMHANRHSRRPECMCCTRGHSVGRNLQGKQSAKHIHSPRPYPLGQTNGLPSLHRYRRSAILPVMSLGERAVALLACRYVADVVMAPPLVRHARTRSQQRAQRYVS